MFNIRNRIVNYDKSSKSIAVVDRCSGTQSPLSAAPATGRRLEALGISQFILRDDNLIDP